jgi:sigma-E factor negative regulatory protein RseB
VKLWLICILLACTPAWADAPVASADTATWLNRVAQATHQLDYQGVFVYQSQNIMNISHVSHLVDNHGEISRLDALSGPAHAFLRIDDNVYCAIYNKPSGDIEHRPHHAFFPEILPYPTTHLEDYYQIRSLGHAKIADHDCEGVLLIPRDAYRYGYALWADSTSHVLLRLIKLDAHGQTASQFAFTQIDIGHAPARTQLSLDFNDKRPFKPGGGGTAPKTAWQISNPPSGFHRVTETVMTLPNHTQPVTQLVYTDGLATVSLFIEPQAQPGTFHQQGLVQNGQMLLYTRPMGQYQVTAVGAVPLATLVMMADNLTSTEAK